MGHQAFKTTSDIKICITLCHSTFLQNPAENTVSKKFEKHQTQSATTNRNASWCSKTSAIYSYPGGIHFSLQSILPPSLQQGKISSDRVNEKNTTFLFKLFILRSNTVNLNPPPQKRIKLENHIISMFIQKKSIQIH